MLTTAVGDAIFERLIGDVGLMALTADYQGTKAIFQDEPIPPGVNPPFIVISGPLLDEAGAFETKNTLGREWVRDIFCYEAHLGTESVVNEMAAMVRDLFHRQGRYIEVDGAAVMIASATGPEKAPTDDTLYGRVVTVTLTAALIE